MPMLGTFGAGAARGFGETSASLLPPGVVNSNLMAYLDSTSNISYPGSGTTWYDISGNGKNFTWTSAPTYTAGAPGYFSTNGKTASGPNADTFGITSNYTIVVVCLVNSLTANYAFYFPTTTQDRGASSHLPWVDGTVYWDTGGCCGADTRTSVASGGSNTWIMWTLSKSSSTNRTIYKNTTALTTNTTAALSPNMGSFPTIINDITRVGGTSWDARLGGFFVYNRGLSSAEVTQNYNALKTRYGL